MSLKIYEAKEEKKEPVQLKLEQLSSCGIAVIAVDSKGDLVDRGCLVRVNFDGTIHLHAGVNSDLGFDLDDDYRIKLSS